MIGSFERFGHTFPVGHLLGERVHLISTGAVGFRQALLQFAGQEQIGKQDRSVLFQIAFPHPAIAAYIQNQLKEDELSNQLTMEDYDPFTGSK